MTVRILRSALEDLAHAREFYGAQGEGLGDYFLHSLFAEIDSLILFAGVHAIHFGYHRLLVKRFLLPSTTVSTVKRRLSIAFWIADAVHARFERLWAVSELNVSGQVSVFLPLSRF